MEGHYKGRDHLCQASPPSVDVNLRRLLLAIPPQQSCHHPSFVRFPTLPLGGGLQVASGSFRSQEAVTTPQASVASLSNATTGKATHSAEEFLRHTALSFVSAPTQDMASVSLRSGCSSSHSDGGEKRGKEGIFMESLAPLEMHVVHPPHSSFPFATLKDICDMGHRATPSVPSAVAVAASHLSYRCAGLSPKSPFYHHWSSYEKYLDLASLPSSCTGTFDSWMRKQKTVSKDACAPTSAMLGGSDSSSGNTEQYGKYDDSVKRAMQATAMATAHYQRDTSPPPAKKMCSYHDYVRNTPSITTSLLSSFVSSGASLPTSLPSRVVAGTHQQSFLKIPHLTTTSKRKDIEDVALPLRPPAPMRQSGDTRGGFGWSILAPHATSELGGIEFEEERGLFRRRWQKKEAGNRLASSEKGDGCKDATSAVFVANMHSFTSPPSLTTNGEQPQDEAEMGISSSDDLRRHNDGIFDSFSKNDSSKEATKKEDSTRCNRQFSCLAASSVCCHEAKKTSYDAPRQNKNKAIIWSGVEERIEQLIRHRQQEVGAKKNDKKMTYSALGPGERQPWMADESVVTSCTEHGGNGVVFFDSQKQISINEDATTQEDNALEDINNKKGAARPEVSSLSCCKTASTPMDVLCRYNEHNSSRQADENKRGGCTPFSLVKTTASLPKSPKVDNKNVVENSSDLRQSDISSSFPCPAVTITTSDAAPKNSSPPSKLTPDAIVREERKSFQWRKQSKKPGGIRKQKGKKKKKKTSHECAVPSRRQRSRRWNDMVDQLRRYRLERGHCIVPRGHEHYNLALWVSEQRKQYRLRLLGRPSNITAERIDVLNGLGFVWNVQEAAWERHFADLVEFKRRHGHAVVPQKCVEFSQLGMWVKEQRRNYNLFKDKKCTKMKEEHLAALRSVGFIFNCLEASWWETYRELEEFRRTNGHCLVPSKYSPNKKLGAWVRRQRLLYKRRNEGDTGAMDDARVGALDKLGFTWVLDSSRVHNSREK